MHAGPGTDRSVKTRMENLDVVVRDGSTLCLREAADDDVDALVGFLKSLSSESRVPPVSRRASALRGHGPCAAQLPGWPGHVAGGRMWRPDRGVRRVLRRHQNRRDRAEVAFAVADALHGHGSAHACWSGLPYRAYDRTSSLSTRT